MSETVNELFSPRQWEFIKNSTKRVNIAHGSVRAGKTSATAFRFMHAVDRCPDGNIFMVGHSADTIYRNVVRLIMEGQELEIFRPFCSWRPGDRILNYKDKRIKCLGAKDEGAIGSFYGLTMSLCYCDEITLYPVNIIDLINTRLSKSYSMMIATCNPTYPTHKVKEWADLGVSGHPDYYSLKFKIEDNIFLPESYIKNIRETTSGIFYRRNYLGEWCLAEGAVFDFFDKNIHVVSKPPRAAEYWIAGIDYGISNAFACVLIGVSTGKYTQTGKCLWVESEYYWDCKVTHRQKLNSELADDIKEFLEPYGVTAIYIDPSALAFKLELQRRGMGVIEANNDVVNGIQMMTSEMAKGNLFVLNNCKNTIKEIENYVWDSKKSKEGEDAPVKKGDHSIDALRYCIATHKVSEYRPYDEKHDPDQYRSGRFSPRMRRF